MAKEPKNQEEVKDSNSNLELELLKAKLALLEGKISKPQTKEEEYNARIVAYESPEAKAKREAMKATIQSARNAIMMQADLLGKCTQEDARALEAFKRRGEEYAAAGEDYMASRMKKMYSEKIKEIKGRLG